MSVSWQNQQILQWYTVTCTALAFGDNDIAISSEVTPLQPLARTACQKLIETIYPETYK